MNKRQRKKRAKRLLIQSLARFRHVMTSFSVTMGTHTPSMNREDFGYAAFRQNVAPTMRATFYFEIDPLDPLGRPHVRIR
jgi:hypothetical protein